jgi:hypothetical protein
MRKVVREFIRGPTSVGLTVESTPGAEPAREIALRADRVGSATAVANVAVRAHDVLRRLHNAEAGERLATRVEQDPRCGLGVACQLVHCN